MALYAIGDLHLCLGASKPMDIFGGAWVGYMEKLREAIGRTIAEAQRKLHLLELDRDGRYKVYNADV